MPTRPIGVFDSGIGGLSVLRELRAALPHEDLVYVADQAYVPYGDRTDAEIRERADAISGRLIAEGAKLVVVACNTATIAAIADLRERFEVPFVGIEPAVKPAAARTRSGVIGVLATGASLDGSKFHGLVERHAEGVDVVTQACPGLVELIEAGALDGAETRRLVEAYTQPLVERGADVIVLGCTHYPLVRPLIQAAAGPAVELLDPGAAIARRAGALLAATGLLRTDGSGTLRFYSTAPGDGRVLAGVWGEPGAVERLDA